MTTYVWSERGFVDKLTSEPMALPAEYVPAMPMLIRDFVQPFESPMSGKMITSRSELREDLKATGCRIVEPDESPTRGKFRNRRFAKKYNLPLADDAKDYDASEFKQDKEAAIEKLDGGKVDG